MKENNQPTLYVFSGLPGSGKTTLAQELANRVSAAYLNIDTIEQGLRDLCGVKVEGEGYRLAYRVATDNLLLGVNVVADSCNPIELTRKEWESVAVESGASPVNIEVLCSDQSEHRLRVESREPSVSGLRLPTWVDVTTRRYDSWSKDRIIIDTARRTESESLEELVSFLAGRAVEI